VGVWGGEGSECRARRPDVAARLPRRRRPASMPTMGWDQFQDLRPPGPVKWDLLGPHGFGTVSALATHVPVAAGGSITVPTRLAPLRLRVAPPLTQPPSTTRCAAAISPPHLLLCHWQARCDRRVGRRRRPRVAAAAAGPPPVTWRAARPHPPSAAMGTDPPPPADTPPAVAVPSPTAAPTASPSKRPRGGSPDGRDLYSVLLPTYNERENLPLMVALLVKAFEETVRWGGGPACCLGRWRPCPLRRRGGGGGAGTSRFGRARTPTRSRPDVGVTLTSLPSVAHRGVCPPSFASFAFLLHTGRGL